MCVCAGWSATSQGAGVRFVVQFSIVNYQLPLAIGNFPWHD